MRPRYVFADQTGQRAYILAMSLYQRSTYVQLLSLTHQASSCYKPFTRCVHAYHGYCHAISTATTSCAPRKTSCIMDNASSAMRHVLCLLDTWVLTGFPPTATACLTFRDTAILDVESPRDKIYMSTGQPSPLILVFRACATKPAALLLRAGCVGPLQANKRPVLLQ